MVQSLYKVIFYPLATNNDKKCFKTPTLTNFTMNQKPTNIIKDEYIPGPPILRI